MPDAPVVAAPFRRAAGESLQFRFPTPDRNGYGFSAPSRPVLGLSLPGGRFLSCGPFRIVPAPTLRVGREAGPLTGSPSSLVATLGEAIARRIGEPRYNLWFDRNTCFCRDGDVLTVGVP